MRNWKDKLFFGGMPGYYNDFDHWLQDLRSNSIGSIVCLTPDDEIAAKSLEYAEWLDSWTSYEIKKLPISDHGIPVGVYETDLFWYTVLEIVKSVEQGDRVFIHCGAGIGRTGMFAIAVIMGLGYEYREACEQIKSAGSFPENDSQMSFITSGPPATMQYNWKTYGFDWRPDQRERTREIVGDIDVVAFSFQLGRPNKGCMLNHLDGSTGYLRLKDAMADKYRVFDYDTDKLLGEYTDTEDLINKGWKVSS